MTGQTFAHCTKHPTTGAYVIAGQHLSSEVCWERDTCRGCRPCTVHNAPAPRPVQRPASNSESRKRDQEREAQAAASLPPRTTCGCGGSELLLTGDTVLVVDGLVHSEITCGPVPSGHGAPA